ncbi:glycosyltransferase [Dokdonia sp. Hel_I_53]|uniref:glycosyltransferase n=1 Tax=Dokdonia sp. Hel_I_53 TaxID=1566287 RepID=UPI001199D39A|nr:glycosyltransferase [Dokdonia sp. Hel_I_53]TVZ51347.1 glycosyltransferase involved in cell wall biosynthesis [Dokdonia sp. Hel_I_53]
MDKGTIIYIGGFELPDRNAAAQRVIGNAKLFNSLGYDVKFIGLTKIDSEVAKKLRFYNFDSYSQKYPENPLSWLRYITAVKYYKKIINSSTNVKAVVGYNLPSISFLMINQFCKRRDIEVYSDCTEWYVTTKERNIFKKIIKSFDVKLRMKSVHKSINGIITISTFLTNYYKNVKGLKITQLPPLVDLEDEKWKQRDLYAEKNSEVVKFVYAGSPALSKKVNGKDRIDLIVNSFYRLSKRINSFELKIIGISKNDYLAIYPESADILSELESKIKFLGRVPHNDALTYLKNADFSIFLRDKSLITEAGFPTKFVESISCGIPVLTNPSSNLSDYLKEGENGYWLDTNNIDNITKQIENVLGMPKDSIALMKSKTLQSRLFHYENFQYNMNKFLIRK